MPLDLAKDAEAMAVLSSLRPDLIVNTVGLTDVDGCEEDPGQAYQLNVLTAHNAAQIANSLGSKLVHISTDQLFDGTKSWRDESHTPVPINTYGATKLEAEKAVLEACPGALVIRTNFYGWGTSIRTSFSDWISRGLEQNRHLTMFTDVFFTPVLVNDLATVIIKLALKDLSGVFHVGGGERLSKHAFALQTAEALGYSPDLILPTSIQEFTFKARRPLDMSLSSKKVETCLGIRMSFAGDGLRKLKELGTRGWPQALEKSVTAPTRGS